MKYCGVCNTCHIIRKGVGHSKCSACPTLIHQDCKTQARKVGSLMICSYCCNKFFLELQASNGAGLRDAGHYHQNRDGPGGIGNGNSAMKEPWTDEDIKALVEEAYGPKRRDTWTHWDWMNMKSLQLQSSRIEDKNGEIHSLVEQCYWWLVAIGVFVFIILLTKT